jgi:hypothetical protein
MPYEADLCTTIAIGMVIFIISSVVAVFMRLGGVPKEKALQKAGIWVFAIWMVAGVAFALVWIIYSMYR